MSVVLSTAADVAMDDIAAPTTAAARFATGQAILPAPEIKSVIDRTALFVARSANPPQFEDKIREGQRSDPKFSFLNPADPYHAYYRHKMDRIALGDLGDDAEKKKEGAEGEEVVEPVLSVAEMGVEPPPAEFTMDLPNISSSDLDIMKLTALFTARRGRPFLAALSTREGRNYQFDFLRPTHSLFGYFNRLVEQYIKVLHPDAEMLKKLNERSTSAGGRWATLEMARKHATWERNKREKDKKRQDDQEAEKTAFAEIDWHDYAIVQTIEFTAVDANSELPPPMSVQEVENMTLAQKRMAAMIMENTAEDVEAHRARQAAADAEMVASVEAAEAAGVNGSNGMDVDGQEEDAVERKKREEAEKKREEERAKALQASSVNTAGPMKIRTDYVAKLGGKNKAAMTTCSICKQQIPVDELQEHMRIELLDPRWKSQRDALEARTAQSSELQRGANVVASLANLAKKRVDIFGAEADEEKRKVDEEEEGKRRKEREKDVWDGHTSSKANTLDRFSTNVNFEEQIAAIHRAKGLGPQAANALGPGIGPSAIPTSTTSIPAPQASSGGPPLSLESTANPAYSAATISSGPQPASMYSNTPPVMLPPLHYQNDPSQGGYTPAMVVPLPQPVLGGGPPGGAGAGMHPSRIAALVAQGQQGTVRSADEMLSGGGEVDDGIPPAKKQRVAKLPGGQLYPEADWINMHPHPISLQVHLPLDTTKPEWKLDGSTVTILDLPLNLLVSSLRDRILQHTASAVPASRIRLSYGGKMLTNASSLGSYNVEDGEELVFSVREGKKK